MKLLQTIITILLAVLVVVFAWGSFTGGFFGGEPKHLTYHNTVLDKIESLGKLELVKHHIKDIVEYKIEYKWWFDSKSVILISGEAVGCIDLTKVKPEHIQEEDSLITIKLPKPELCYHKVNHKETRIHSSESWTIGKTDPATLHGRAFKEAEKNIRKAALKGGILDQTKKNGEQMLKPLFEELSGKKVTFTYEP